MSTSDLLETGSASRTYFCGRFLAFRRYRCQAVFDDNDHHVFMREFREFRKNG